jgi:putative hydrolase of the HAD superfamily
VSRPELTAGLMGQCHYTNACDLFPETRAVLEQLSREYRLGVISNAYPSFVRAFERLDIRRYFQHVVLSADVGVEKPDERIYRHALDAMQSDASASAFVDDQAENVAAARTLGMRAFHLVRRPGPVRCDLRNLDDLRPCLQA